MDWKPASYLTLSLLLAWPLDAVERAPARASAPIQAAAQTEPPAGTLVEAAARSQVQAPAQGAARALELNNFALTFDEQGKLKESETSYREALKVWKEWGGPENPGLMSSLTGLANVLRLQGQYFESEQLFRRAIAIGEKLGEAVLQNLAFSLTGLGALYCDQHRPSQAVPFLERAVAVGQQVPGAQRIFFAPSWNSLGDAFVQRRRLDEAEELYRRSLEVLSSPDAPPFLLAVTDFKLAELHFRYRKKDDVRRLAQAEEFYGRAAADLEGTTSQDHPLMGMALRGLAEVYLAQQRYSDAEPLLTRALQLQQQRLGPKHPQVAKVLFDYAQLLRKTNNRREATSLEKRAKSILKAFEDEHPGRGSTVDFSTLEAR